MIIRNLSRYGQSQEEFMSDGTLSEGKRRAWGRSLAVLAPFAREPEAGLSPLHTVCWFEYKRMAYKSEDKPEIVVPG